MKIQLDKFNKVKALLVLVKVLPWLGWSTLLAIIFFSGNFLYQYFYRTITEAQDIYIIRTQVSLQALDIKLYETVLSAIESKANNTLIEQDNFYDPFYGIQYTPPANEEVLTEEQTKPPALQ